MFIATLEALAILPKKQRRQNRVIEPAQLLQQRGYMPPMLRPRLPFNNFSDLLSRVR